MIMNKKYQVFISSTFSDLIEERQDTIRSVLDLGHIPSGMEVFPAADVEQFEYIKKDRRRMWLLCPDHRRALWLHGHRRSKLHRKEYDYAVERKKTVLAFIHGDPGSVAVAKADIDPALAAKLTAFRKKVLTGRLVQFWMSRENLKSKVIVALSKAFSDVPGIGWIRGDAAAAQAPSWTAEKTALPPHSVNSSSKMIWIWSSLMPAAASQDAPPCPWRGRWCGFLAIAPGGPRPAQRLRGAKPPDDAKARVRESCLSVGQPSPARLRHHLRREPRHRLIGRAEIALDEFGKQLVVHDSNAHAGRQAARIAAYALHPSRIAASHETVTLRMLRADPAVTGIIVTPLDQADIFFAPLAARTKFAAVFARQLIPHGVTPTLHHQETPGKYGETSTRRVRLITRRGPERTPVATRAACHTHEGRAYASEHDRSAQLAKMLDRWADLAAKANLPDEKLYIGASSTTLSEIEQDCWRDIWITT
jgi:hypothetical protein